MSTHKHSLPCECVGTCGIALVVAIEAYGNEPLDFYVEFYTTYQGGLRSRLRVAWRVLRGKDPWLHDVALSGEQMKGLRDFIAERVDSPV